MENLACEAITGAIDAGAGAVVAGGAKAALAGIVEFVIDGTGWLLGQLTGLIDGSTRPDVTSGWFRGAYGDMAAIALLGLLPFLLLAIIQGIVRQDLGQLVRSAFVFVPLAALGTGAAVVVVDMLVTITDGMSNWIGRNMGSDLNDFATGLGTAVAALALPTGGAAAGFAALLGAIVVGFATFVIWLELVLRQGAIYVAVLFLPLGFMAMVWPATAHWLRRLVQGLVAIILSKFVIVAVMALAATALDTDVATDGYGVVVGGGALLSLAALAPYVLLRLIPVFDAGMTSQLEGTLRRPTAAVAPPGGGRSQIAHMLHQRLANTGGGAGPTVAAAGAAGGGPSGLMGAVGLNGGKPGAAAVAGGAAAAGTLGVATAGAKAAQAGLGTASQTGEATVSKGTESESKGRLPRAGASGDVASTEGLGGSPASQDGPSHNGTGLPRQDGVRGPAIGPTQPSLANGHQPSTPSGNDDPPPGRPPGPPGPGLEHLRIHPLVDEPGPDPDGRQP
ncbi:hypothetical protein [Salsipaludibacter albus]|uniref:hypothetical protein n=1 Tax=Salsipaludibacter albus TaxID=2849650 RepID=UPI001EE46487|nr:hypothetical protein [Salsipaludibacter albus]MBY5161475.1 hypothetical protein [Salsipaludibacter albus]